MKGYYAVLVNPVPFFFVSMQIISITKYPNNEIRCRIASPRAPHVDETAIANNDAAEQLEQKSHCQGSDSLDISAELERVDESDSLKPGWGGKPRETSFGTYARRQLLRCGGVFDKIDTIPAHSIFLTGTLPGSTDEAKQTIANYSAYIVHSLKAWINWHVPSKLDFYVWELQKRGALHLHYCVYVPDAIARNYLLSEFRNEWERILSSVCVMSGIDIWRRDDSYTHADDKSVLQAYAQEVTKSVAAYLSKYCSKQSSKHSSDQSLKYFPSRWWGCSRPLLAKLREMTETHTVTDVSVARQRRTFELLTDDLNRYSILSYSYPDKFGMGQNAVFYYKSEDLESVMTQIRESYVTTSQEALLSAQKAIAELARILFQLSRAPGIDKVISANLSEKSRVVAEKLRRNEAINSFDAFALSSELSALARNYSATRNHIPNLIKQLPLRCDVISSRFSNEILVEGLIPFARNNPAK
jgi:hypothetical protein